MWDPVVWAGEAAAGGPAFTYASIHSSLQDLSLADCVLPMHVYSFLSTVLRCKLYLRRLETGFHMMFVCAHSFGARSSSWELFALLQSNTVCPVGCAVVCSLLSLTFSLPASLTHHTAAWAFLLLSQPAKPHPISEPLHVIGFPWNVLLPGICMTCYLTLFSYLIKCHFITVIFQTTPY